MKFKSKKEYNYEVEKQWRMSLSRYNNKELLNIFPEAKEVIRNKIIEHETLQASLTKEIKRHLTIIKNIDGDEFSKWFCREWVKANKVQKLLEIEKQTKKLKGILMFASNKTPKGWVTEDQIQQAIAVPIETLINQPLRRTSKSLVCLCPLHDEKTPSFHIYLETNSC
ncbi:MAG: hypothetical protein KAI71_02575 [Candidatus Pacebacteria bacterium]|nr:hypothetical protein [Candidatus Paceibacterota bacterium]